jgi:hypothetical protein
MSDSTSFEPGDDTCPPWWPHWWRKPKGWPPRPPVGFEKFEQMHLMLAIHEMASQLKDAGVAKDIQGAAKAGLRKQFE